MSGKNEMSSSTSSRVSPTKETRETMGNACCDCRHEVFLDEREKKNISWLLVE